MAESNGQHRRMWSCAGIGVIIGLLGAVLAVVAGTTTPAGATEIEVPCGDVAALRAAITTANATPEPDVIVLGPGSPCAFTLTDAAVATTSGNVGLPTVTAPLTIEGNGASITRAGTAPAFRLFLTAAPLTLRDLTLTGGSLTGTNHHGAAVAAFATDVVLDRTTVAFNAVGTTVSAGGGAVATVGGSLHVVDSIVAVNAANFGGAIYAAASEVTVERSLIAFNSASFLAGAVYLWGGTATFENDTVSFNAGANGMGGIVAVGVADLPVSVAVQSTTMSDNGIANNPAPGVSLTAWSAGDAASISVRDSIVSDTDGVEPGTSVACSEITDGTIVDLGGNIEWPTDTCGFDTVADPMLGALAFNGGPTQTQPILPGSPALELAGDDCPALDQRSEPRPGGDACDSGAYEAQPPQTTITDAPSPTNAPSISFEADQDPATFECSVDDGEWQPCTSPFAPDQLADGEHTVAVRATNGDGYTDPSPATASILVDTTAPVVIITEQPESPSTDTTPTVGFEADDPDAAFECSVDGAEWEACDSPFTTEPLEVGEHTIAVRATDAAGNTSPDDAAVVEFEIVDSVDPVDPVDPEEPTCRLISISVKLFRIPIVICL